MSYAIGIVIADSYIVIIPSLKNSYATDSPKLLGTRGNLDEKCKRIFLQVAGVVPSQNYLKYGIAIA